MALTRPNSHQINFDVTNISDSVITVNKLKPQPGVNSNDAGLMVVRGSTESNAILFWDESEDKFVFGITADDGSTNGTLAISATADLKVNTITDNSGNIFLTDAPSDGSSYLRKDAGWDIASHNTMTTLQGGTTNEYYHLTAAQHTAFDDKLSNTDTISGGTY